MLQLDLRAASWRGDWEGVRHVRDQLRTLTIISARSLLHYANYVLSPETEDLEARIAEVTHPGLSPRFWTLIHQLLAKAYGVRGQTARCLDHVQRATAAALVDLEWLEYCPAIECVRKLPEFVEIEDRVRLRTHAIWSV